VNIGAFHESLNLASVMKLPVVFVCENNLYGQYTHISRSTAVANIANRAASYSMPGVVVDGNNVLEVYSAAQRAVEVARTGGGPTLIECKTYRQKGHSRTDPGKYRPDAEVQEWMKRDPIVLFREWLKSNGLLTESDEIRIRAEQMKLVEKAYEFASSSPYPQQAEVETHVYI